MWLMLCWHPRTLRPAHSHATNGDRRRGCPRRSCAGLGSHRHPVSTSSPERRVLSHQGLRFVYAFKPRRRPCDRSDARAARPHRWAWPTGASPLPSDPTFNTRGRGRTGRRRPTRLCNRPSSSPAKGPENERLYIEALARRHFGATDSDRHGAPSTTATHGRARQALSDDLDAATLFAEAA